MESTKCESVGNTDAEQLATAPCTSAQQNGEPGGGTPVTAKSDRLAADCLQKKRHRAEETTEERAARLQSYIPFCARCSHHACATVSAKLAQLWQLLAKGADVYIYIYMYI